ncbi:MAG: hypothetical protein AAF922_13395 [Pseudomonadota bacterium]
MAQKIEATDSSPQQLERLSIDVRRSAFFLLMAFIFLGPAPGQLFGWHSSWLREWVMFSDVGVGIPDGTFTVAHADGTTETHSPLEAVGLESYPLIRHYLFEGRVFEASDLAKFATELCTQAELASSVSFKGKVGTRNGWQPMQAEDICAETELQP